MPRRGGTLPIFLKMDPVPIELLAIAIPMIQKDQISGVWLDGLIYQNGLYLHMSWMDVGDVDGGHRWFKNNHSEFFLGDLNYGTDFTTVDVDDSNWTFTLR
jgi:hypothetical protein